MHHPNSTGSRSHTRWSTFVMPWQELGALGRCLESTAQISLQSRRPCILAAVHRRTLLTLPVTGACPKMPLLLFSFGRRRPKIRSSGSMPSRSFPPLPTNWTEFHRRMLEPSRQPFGIGPCKRWTREPVAQPPGDSMNNDKTPSTADTGARLYSLSIFFMAISDISGKWLSAFFPVGQVVFARSLVAAITNSVLAYRKSGRLFTIVPALLPLHGARGLVIFLVNLLFFMGASRIPLADATTIFMIGSLLASFASAAMFREGNMISLSCSNALGFLGAVIILDPVWGTNLMGGMFVLASAIGYAVGTLLQKYAAQRDDEGNVGVLGNGFAAAIGVTTLPFASAMPGGHDWLVFVAIGAAAGTATFLSVMAFNRTNLSVLMILDYWIVGWAAIADYFIWQTLPSLASLLGYAMIFAATWVSMRPATPDLHVLVDRAKRLLSRAYIEPLPVRPIAKNTA
jgi:S-adenosylmethionine uptake transporter